VPIPVTGLSRDWIEAEAALPVGWRVSGLVREPDETWRAWALPGPHAGDPNAAPIEGRGGSAEQALRSLARNAQLTHGPLSGEESTKDSASLKRPIQQAIFFGRWCRESTAAFRNHSRCHHA